MHRVHKAQKDFQELLGRLEALVQQEVQERLVLQDRQGAPVTRALQEEREALAFLEYKVLLDSQDLPEPRGLLVPRD